MSRAALARKSDPDSSGTRATSSSSAKGLRVSEPDDALEREADRVADAVSAGRTMPQWSLTRIAAPAAGAEKPHEESAARDEKDASQSEGALAAREKVRSDRLPVQRMAADNAAVVEDMSAVDEVLRAPGSPLDHETRRFMESRMGFDFSKIKIHTDPRAAASARRVGALAYTVGSDVVFAEGRFAPHTTAGRRLLAHELTHVVQQSPLIAQRAAGICPAPVHLQRDVDESAEDRDTSHWYSNPIEKIKKAVRKLPGYKLFRVILGKDPITNEEVKATPTNLIQGVLNLVPGGDAAFERIQESGALEKAFKWVSEQIDQLGLTWDYFKGLINTAVDSLKVGDITEPEAALERIAAIFRPAYDKVKTFASAALRKGFELAMEVVMEKMGGTAILDILRKAGETFLTIIKDPVKFLKNLIASLVQGFNQFKDHIEDHLKEGLVQWLFGEIQSTGIKLPKRFDFSGIVGMVLQVLGLTWDKFRQKLVGLLGEEAVSYLEGAFDFLMQLAKAKDLSVIWKMILAKADRLIDTVLNSVKQWAITKIVTAAVIKLATLFNPVGAVIQAIQTIYTTINFFIEKAKQLASLIEAITNSLSAIAAGNLTQAANFVERSMARAIAPILGFLADEIGLTGIGKAVRDIVLGVQEKVDKAIDQVLDYIVQKGRAFYEKGKAAASKVLAWWQQRKDVLVGDEEHSIYMEGTEDAPHIMIASVPGVPWSEYLQSMSKKTPANKKALLKETQKIVDDLEKPLSPSSTPEEKSKRVEEKRVLFNQVAKNIVALGFSSEKKAPASVIEYGGTVQGEDEAGELATASVLSQNHPPGTVPSDEPPIWTKLGDLIGKKRYVRGHLLNHNLGGEGRRSNLTPINEKTNKAHLNAVERAVKKAVNPPGNKVVYYQVKAIYGVHENQPKRFRELKAKPPSSLTKEDRKELKELEAEQRLCTSFDWTTYELSYIDGKWTKDKNTKVESDSVKHRLEG
jgi:hypothetical protein